jgi:hypothetical protein
MKGAAVGSFAFANEDNAAITMAKVNVFSIILIGNIFVSPLRI